MRKPKNKCLIKLSSEDVKAAIDAYVNDGKITGDTKVISVKNSRSKDYMIVAEIE